MKEDNREKPRQEGDARKITAGIGILCAQSEKGRRAVLQYLAAFSRLGQAPQSAVSGI